MELIGQPQELSIGSRSADQRQTQRQAVDGCRRQADLGKAAQTSDAEQADRLVTIGDFNHAGRGVFERRSPGSRWQTENTALRQAMLQMVDNAFPFAPGDRLLLRTYPRCEGHAFVDARAECRLLGLDPGAKVAPDFSALDRTETCTPFIQITWTQPYLGGVAEMLANTVHRGREGVPDRIFDQIETISGHQQAMGFRRWLIIAQEGSPDLFQDRWIPCEPSKRVKARGERNDARWIDAAMGRTHAEDPAIACRQPDRSGAIGAKRKVHEAACHGRD